LETYLGADGNGIGRNGGMGGSFGNSRLLAGVKKSTTLVIIRLNNSGTSATMPANKDPRQTEDAARKTTGELF